MAKIAFIGLGVMGYPMAGHLKNKGHELVVYNRTREKAEKWCQQYVGGNSSKVIADNPAEAAKDADFIFSCIGNDQDLRQITTGENNLFQNCKQGAIYIDNTTASADVAIEISQIAQSKNCYSLDAPVSGGEIGAQNASLSVMVGGNEKIFQKAKPIISCYAGNIVYIGKTGAGQLAKMVNQICIAGVLQSLSEALHFALRAKLDIDAVLKVISKGAAASWQMHNRAETMVEGKFEFGFAVELMRKDLDICIKQAKKYGAQLPVTALVDQFYAKLQKEGRNKNDTSSLICLLEDFDGK